MNLILDQFKWGDEEGYYSIYPRFEMIIPKDEEEGKRWQKQRRSTYLGSFRHFISCLANRSAEMDGYQMFLKEPHEPSGAQGTRVFTDQLVSTVDGVGLQLNFEGFLQVSFRGASNTSSIRLKQNNPIIKSTGEIYPPLSVILYGTWATHRVADLLPLDYRLALNP